MDGIIGAIMEYFTQTINWDEMHQSHYYLELKLGDGEMLKHN